LLLGAYEVPEIVRTDRTRRHAERRLQVKPGKSLAEAKRRRTAPRTSGSNVQHGHDFIARLLLLFLEVVPLGAGSFPGK
jgi:hypothetical protein